MNWKRLRSISLYAAGGVLVAAAVILLVIQQARLTKLSGELSERTAYIVEELRKAAESGDETRQNVILLADETNRILRALRLPARQFSFGTSDEGEAPSEEVSAYLLGVDEIESSWKEKQSQAVKENLWAFLSESLQSAPYALSEPDPTSIRILISGEKAFDVGVEEDGTITLKAVNGELETFTAADGKLVDSILAMAPAVVTIIEKKNEMENMLRSAIDEVVDDEYFISRNIVLDWGSYSIGDIEVVSAGIVRKGSLLLTMYPDPLKNAFIVGGKELPSADQLLTETKILLDEIDIRSVEEKKIDQLKNEMAELLEDSGFNGFIEGRGLRLLDKKREDTDYYYYDLYDAKDNRIGAFGIQKFLGELYMVDHEDVPISAIKTLQVGEVKKN